jgi:hypothetical protein
MPVQAISTTPKRLRILGEEEIEALYGRPCFTPAVMFPVLTPARPACQHSGKIADAR